MSLNFVRFAALVALFSLAVGSAFSQEAVDVEKSGKPREEPTIEVTPGKNTKKRAVETKAAKSLQELMRPEEFQAAGLDKLSEDELQHLDAWLQGYRQTTEKKASAQAEVKASEEIKKASEQAQAKASEEIKKATEEATRTAKASVESRVSRVDGNFEGLKGRTLIKLEDGSVWRQANADDHYRTIVTDHPAAVVLHTTFGYKMRIEGTPEFYVDPVSRPQ